MHKWIQWKFTSSWKKVQSFYGLLCVWMNLEVLSSMILGNTGKLNVSSMKGVKSHKRWGSFLAILDFFWWENHRKGSSFVQIMFLVAFGEDWVSLFANLLHAVLNKESISYFSKRPATWRPRKHLNSLPLCLDVYVNVLWLCFVAQWWLYRLLYSYSWPFPPRGRREVTKKTHVNWYRPGLLQQ